MASIKLGESSVCDKSQNGAILKALYGQKQSSTFCDVIMKVCGKEIFAHSNVLAAASPYFQGFLSLDLPRQFSQRAPQVIEIQIDGSEPNMFYEEAVSAVIDFIYTGALAVRDDNVGQIVEIAKIMQMDNIVKFCDEFLNGNLTPGDVLMDKKLQHEKAVNTLMSDAPLTLFGTKAKHPHSLGYKMRAKKLKSVAVQVRPKLINGESDEVEMKDMGTSTEKWPMSRVDFSVAEPKKRGRPPKSKSNILLVEEKLDLALLSQIDEIGPQYRDVESPEQETEIVNPESGVMESIPTNDADSNKDSPTESNEKQIETELNDAEDDNDTRENVENTENDEHENLQSVTSSIDSGSVEETFLTLGKSTRSGRVRKLPSKLRDSEIMIEKQYTPSRLLKKIKEEPIDSSDVASAVKEPQQVAEVADTLQETSDIGGNEAAEAILESEEMHGVTIETEDGNVQSVTLITTEYEIQQDHDLPERQDQDRSLNKVIHATKKRKRHYHRKSLVEETDMFDDIEPSLRGKYSCDLCNFVTNKVREMSNHHKLHKFEQNTCYYCDVRFEDRDELSVHIEKHKGPRPFFCPTCQHRFKSRTMLNMHLPKHSDDKPFICEICSASFKWKHALKGHMVTHSNKKEHLCDICGYSTAHKSQLKAHHLIHTGELFKCDYPYCNYQSTKKQNLKYHYLTHTREKPHQCEVCGQAFSLVKNMRRHMLLHGKEKKFKCLECEFSSTRYDKLKEHRLKQHGFGTPPEKRIKTTDMLHQNFIAPSKIKKEVGEEDTVDAAISETSEMVVDAEGTGEVGDAAVVLQAIEEEQVVAEIERHVQGVGVVPEEDTQEQEDSSFVIQSDADENATEPKAVEVQKLSKPETFLQIADIGKGQSMKVLRMTPDQLAKFSQIPINILPAHQIGSSTSVQNLVFSQQSFLAPSTSGVKTIAGQEGATKEKPHMISVSQDQDKVVAIAQGQVDELQVSASTLSHDSADGKTVVADVEASQLVDNSELNYIATDDSIGYAMSDGTYIGADGNTYITTDAGRTGSGEGYQLQEYITADGHVVQLDPGAIIASEDGTLAVQQETNDTGSVVVGEGGNRVEYAEIMVSADQVGNIVTTDSSYT